MSHERGTESSALPPTNSNEDLYKAILNIYQRLDTIQHVHGTFELRQVSALSQPTAEVDELLLWEDTDNSKYYIIAQIDETQVKVELT